MHGAIFSPSIHGHNRIAFLAPCGIRPPRMVEVQILQEPTSVRPSLDITASPSWLLAEYRPSLDIKKPQPELGFWSLLGDEPRA